MNNVKYADPLRYSFQDNRGLRLFVEYTFCGSHNYHSVAIVRFEGGVITHWREHQHIDAPDSFWPDLSAGAFPELDHGRLMPALHLDSPGAFVLIPPNISHPATTDVESTLLFLTPGAGTEHRPVGC